MELIRKHWHIIAGLACVVLLGLMYYWRQPTTPVIHTPERTSLTASEPATPEQTPPPPPTDLVVHIEGAVAQPGVFTLPYGSRVNDALELAGGPTEEADLSRINLAAFLVDAQQVIIPIEGTQETPEQATTPQATESNHLININKANEHQLTSLPGIGPVIANNIITHRESEGPFTSIEDLQNVPRIGTTTLNNIRDFISVE